MTVTPDKVEAAETVDLPEISENTYGGLTGSTVLVPLPAQNRPGRPNSYRKLMDERVYPASAGRIDEVLALGKGYKDQAEAAERQRTDMQRQHDEELEALRTELRKAESRIIVTESLLPALLAQLGDVTRAVELSPHNYAVSIDDMGFPTASFVAGDWQFTASTIDRTLRIEAVITGAERSYSFRFGSRGLIGDDDVEALKLLLKPKESPDKDNKQDSVRFKYYGQVITSLDDARKAGMTDSHYELAVKTVRQNPGADHDFTVVQFGSFGAMDVIDAMYGARGSFRNQARINRKPGLGGYDPNDEVYPPRF